MTEQQTNPGGRPLKDPERGPRKQYTLYLTEPDMEDLRALRRQRQDGSVSDTAIALIRQATESGGDRVQADDPGRGD